MDGSISVTVVLGNGYVTQETGQAPHGVNAPRLGGPSSFGLQQTNNSNIANFVNMSGTTQASVGTAADVKWLRAIVAHLVKERGGAVTIDPADIYNMDLKAELIFSTIQDPERTVIEVRQK